MIEALIYDTEHNQLSPDKYKFPQLPEIGHKLSISGNLYKVETIRWHYTYSKNRIFEPLIIVKEIKSSNRPKALIYT